MRAARALAALAALAAAAAAAADEKYHISQTSDLVKWGCGDLRAAPYEFPSTNLARWSWLYAVLREDIASRPTPQK